MFAEGLAPAADEPRATKAALANPGHPLRRAVGASGPFSLDTTELPKLPAAPRQKSKTAKRSSATASEPPKARPHRRPLDRAESALRDLQAQRRAAEDDFRARLRAIEQERSAAFADLDATLAKAKDQLDGARRAYRLAGGSD